MNDDCMSILDSFVECSLDIRSNVCTHGGTAFGDHHFVECKYAVVNIQVHELALQCVDTYANNVSIVLRLYTCFYVCVIYRRVILNSVCKVIQFSLAVFFPAPTLLYVND